MSDGTLLVVLIAIFLSLLGGLVYISNEEGKERTRLIEQCMADGKKEYECKAMFKRADSSTTYIPIVVPVR